MAFGSKMRPSRDEHTYLLQERRHILREIIESFSAN